MFQQIRIRFHNSLLSKRIKNLKVERNPGNFASASTIGIVFDAGQPDAVNIARDYSEALKKQGKSVDILGFVNDKNRHNEYPFKHFNRRDLNWCFVPTSNLVQQFMNTPFDILVCLYTDEVLPLEYVSALSKAHLRVGRYVEGKTYCLDLMIDMHGSKDLKNLVGQIDNYLKIINKKKEQYV